MERGEGLAGTDRPVSGYKISVSHLGEDSFGARGRRSFFQYRDLGIADATDGDFGFTVVRAKPGDPATTDWHFHTCALQVVYCLNGWEDLRFEDGRTVRLLPGSCLNIPPGAGHIEVSYSPDMEVLVSPAPPASGRPRSPHPIWANRPIAGSHPAHRSVRQPARPLPAFPGRQAGRRRDTPSTRSPTPMPSIQTSLLTPMPADVGQMLPGLRSTGVRAYMARSAPENPVRAAPATAFGTSGASSRALGQFTRGEQLEEPGRRDGLEEREGGGSHAVDGLRLVRCTAPLLQPGVGDEDAGGETGGDVAGGGSKSNHVLQGKRMKRLGPRHADGSARIG